MNDLTSFFSYVFKSRLLILGIIIYLSFNISALGNHWYDYFFFGSSIHHCCQGLDFYQIPNAMYAFIHGGDLTGNMPNFARSYSYPFNSNYNVYHPLITVIFGSFFILFNPVVSFNLWILLKIPITLAAIFYLYKNFHPKKYLDLSMFLFLINFSQYNEIKISQYQFLFNISIFLFLIYLIKNKSKAETGILFFLTLIAKPIGLLWIPILIIRKQFVVILIGSLLFIISTLTFNLLGLGQYFTNNLISHILRPEDTKGIIFMSLYTLLRNGYHLPDKIEAVLKIISFGVIYLLSLDKKINILKIFFLLSVYFLFFYDLIFQYHFSLLGPLLSLCVLNLSEFQKKITKILALIISLPTVFFILQIFNIYIDKNTFLGNDPTSIGWQIVSIFQILPILVLTIIVIIPDIKRYIRIVHVSS